jgi:hypothetical protein
VCWFLLTAYVVPSSPILATLTMEALRSSENSVVKQPHGVTSHKSAFFTVTALKASIVVRTPLEALISAYRLFVLPSVGRVVAEELILHP